MRRTTRMSSMLSLLILLALALLVIVEVSAGGPFPDVPPTLEFRLPLPW
jgi:hypothetical protein